MQSGTDLELFFRKARRVSLPALVLLCFAAPELLAARIYPSEGSTSASFLKIGVGARAVGMAGAYTAVPGDAYAMYWNPAGLAAVPYRTLAFTHNEYFAGMGQEYASYAQPVAAPFMLPDGGVGSRVAGVSLNYFYTGNDIERRSGLYEGGGAISPVEGRFGAYDMALAFGYAGDRSRALRTGAAVKLIRQSIDTESAYGAALDLGALYNFERFGRGFTAGFVLQNIGPGLRFVDRTYRLPLTAKAGLSHRLPGGTLLALDLAKPVDNYPSLALGMEHPLGGRLLLRAGYRYRQHGNESGELSGLAFGVGFVSGRFTFDYALAPFGELGNTHRFSAAMRFLEPGEAGLRAASRPAPGMAMASARRLPLRFERKPMTISRAGVSFLVRGYQESARGGLAGISYISVMRSQGQADPAVSEGKLPDRLLADFPVPAGPDLAWQFSQAPAGVSGEIKFELDVPAATAGETVFFYRTREGWKNAGLKGADCSAEYCRRTASAPPAQAYALVYKKP